jgi:Domain of unknown function (DUF4234)
MAAPEVPIKNGDGRVKLRNPVNVLILDIVTLGIYGLFWWYYVNREMADLGRARGTTELGTNPMNSLLALIPGGLIIVPAIMTIINTGKRIKTGQGVAGRPQEMNEWIGLVLMLVFAPVALWYYQEQLNKVWESEAESPALEAGAPEAAATGAATEAAAPQAPEGAAAPTEPAPPGSAPPPTPPAAGQQEPPEGRPPGP